MSLFGTGFMPSGTMGIDQSTLNDFNRIQCQQVGFDMGGNTAKLFLFSPQSIPPQVARPFMYQFTPDFIDTVKSQQSLQMAVGPYGKPSESVLKAILPSAEGMMMNTSTLQNMWSFVLIVDAGNSTTGTIMKPGVRKIAIGYMTDEPISLLDPSNPKLNPNSFMLFTHSNTQFIKRSAGPTSPEDGKVVYTSQDVDYANDTTAMMFDEKLLLGTPKEIMNFAQEQRSNPTGITDYTSIDLGVVKAGSNDVKMIDNTIKAPRQQLSDIMTAIDNGIDYTTQEAPIINRFMTNDEMYTPPNERAFATSINNMPSASGLQLGTGLDTTKAISLGELQMMYPDIAVFPFNIPVQHGYGWDVSNQAGYNSSGKLAPIMSPRNQLSFLVSSVIQALCSQCGVSQTAFQYMSKDTSGQSFKPQEYFQYLAFDLVVPRTPAITTSTAGQFYKYMQEQLFDIIRAVAGDFEVHVIANMGGDILINLKLYAFPDPEDGTYFQTSARLGGMMNPMLGSVQVINNNVLQLSNATETLIGDNFSGMSMFNYSNGASMDSSMY